MKCRDVRRLSTEYVEGDLDERRSSAVRGHLRLCDDCRDAVADEVSVRDALTALEPVDPPAELWARIGAELADAEIADARRPRAWLWWQAARRHAFTGAIAAAAVVVAATWVMRRDRGERERAVATAPDAATGGVRVAGLEDRANDDVWPDGPGAGETREHQLARADARYTDTIAELRDIVATERATWPTERAAELDARLRDLERRQQQARHAASADPRSRDALYDVYRQEIAVLQDAIVTDEVF